MCSGWSSTPSTPCGKPMGEVFGLIDCNNFYVSCEREYQIDRKSLLKLLREKTDLSGYVLDTFCRDLELLAQGRLDAVKVRHEVLEQIGYFID